MSFKKHRMVQKRSELIKRPKIITDTSNFPASKLPLSSKIYRTTANVDNVVVLENTGYISFSQAKSQESAAVPAIVGKKYGNSWETNWFFIEFKVPDDWDQLAANEDEFHLLWNSNSEASLYDYDTGKYLQAFSVPTRNFYILDRNGDRHFKFAIEMANNGNTEVNPDLVDDQFPSGSWFVFSSCQIGLLRKNMYDLRSDFNLLYDIANSMTEDNYQYGELSYGILHQM